MAQILTVDIENLDTSSGLGYVMITFPNRTKIINATFTVNPEAYGTEEQDRMWTLYALASHPYVDEDDAWEWTWPIFFESAKPVVDRANNIYFRSDTAQTGVTRQPDGTPSVFREAHHGVMAPGDYVVMWVQADGGDFEGIAWENTRAVITLTYEETTRGTTWENRDWAAP